MPEPYINVPLWSLGIDSESLELIKQYLVHNVYCPVNVQLERGKTLREVVENDWDFAFISNIDPERLLLLALAAHKLGIQCMQNLVNAKISEMLRFTCKEQASEMVAVELSDDKPLDDCLKILNDWALFITPAEPKY